MRNMLRIFSRKKKVQELGTCGCDKPNLIHIKAHWGMGSSQEFLYCQDCIKSDVSNGILIEIL